MTGLKIGSLFSGIGGLDLAVEEFFGAETAWHCEWEAEPSKVLAARWPGVPNLHDVTKVDWANVEPVDIMCGGFPCQDVSLAGRRRGMKEGTRSGLWAEFARAIDIVRPAVVVIENVRGLLSADAGGDVEPCPWCMGDGADEYHLRALDAVLADLSDLGFDAEWTGLRAADVGAPHGRFRFFLLAYARDFRHERPWPSRRRRDGSSDSYIGGADASVDRALFSTPDTVPEAPNTGSNSHKAGNIVGLGNQVKSLFPTPTASEGDKGGPGQKHGNGDSTLSGSVSALLPTPRASRGAAATETMYKLGAERDDTGDRQGNVVGEVNWGEYEPAVRLWESLTRPAPAPTLPDGKNGNHRLSAAFCEWMMGYPAGWVTDVIGRNAAIKACGNGVVPQQAFAALTELWARVGQEVAA